VQTLQTHPLRARLGVRARLLLALERLFPVVAAPCQSGEHAAYEFAKAAGSFAGHAERIGGLTGKRVLDFGCGWGGETVWLAQHAQEAVGCDISSSALADAARFAAKSRCGNARFAQISGGTIPEAPNSFDAVFSTNVFEHVMDVEGSLREIARVLRPGGSFLSTFGPLFHSPLGYHLPWATQVPYAHLVFGLNAVIQVRNLKRGPIYPASWEETGLNRITFGKFRAAVRAVGFEAKTLRRVPVRRLRWLSAIPVVGDLATFGIECHLVKRVSALSSPPKTGSQVLAAAA
jgi:SAM-dependent methyltransferase